jgi:hypothetical protein
MICFGCSAKISNSEINRQRMRNRVGQCSRLWVFRCDKCKKMFNYLSFQQHKELFKKTLIYINEGAEEVARFQALWVCRSFSSNVGQCYSFGENLNGISDYL